LWTVSARQRYDRLDERRAAFVTTAHYYDRIYSFKDYAGEVSELLSIIDRDLHTGGRRLLDVACGTGLHLQYLKAHFEAEGLDVSPELLEIARERNPELTFHCDDMRSFSLDARYDVITCLFSSIGYMTTLSDLRRAIARMADHLVPGGILFVEPWFTPDMWKPNSVHALFIDEPELKIARINTSLTEGCLSIFDLHHLIGTPEGTEHIVEHHGLGLYTVDEMTEAFEAALLEVRFDPKGLTGRGLHVARRL
jgi:SAM-dependent methyltransferase